MKEIKITNKSATDKEDLDWATKTTSDEKSGEDEFNWIEDLKDLNLDLEERILAANKDKTKVKWNKLLPDLMVADILMVGQFSDKTDANGNRQLNILMMQKDGHVIVPFFTNPDRIKAMSNPNNTSFDVMKVNTVRFFQSIKGKPCVLNPLSDYARIFTPFEMKVLAAENENRVPLLEVKN